jgi:RimJ/RimL family protein N-acetyltransferase
MLEDDNIKLRALTINDAPQIATLINNNKILNNLRDRVPNPFVENDALNFILSVQENEPQVVFGIEFEGHFCGIISLMPQMDVHRQSAEIGYWIGEPFWGKSIATTATKLITKYGFETLQLIKIYGIVFEHNTASMRVLEKCGYEKEAVLKRAITKNNIVMDEHRFAIFRS